MRSLDRRKFMTGSLGAASLAMVSKGPVRGANERVVVGIMGLGGRGTRLAENFAQRPDVEVAYLCDVDTRRFGRARKLVEAAQRTRPKLVQDFRKILDDDGVDALVNATPDHWHALGTILACQAGKDVFVEKPMAHSVWEGRKMVEAEARYGRVVQVGMQSRSAPYVHRAREYIRAGNLGDVHLVRVYNMMQHPKREPVPDGPVPDGLDWDLWCGPAAKRPYNPGLYWLNHREYSCGPIAGDLVHQLDLARFLIGDPPAPRATSHQGAIYSLQDGRDTPDTQMALYEYDGLTMTMQSTLWTPYMKKTPGVVRNTDRFPDWPFSSTKVEVLGTDGYHVFRPSRRRLAGLRRRRGTGAVRIRPPGEPGAPGRFRGLHPDPPQAGCRCRDRPSDRDALPPGQHLLPGGQPAPGPGPRDRNLHRLSGSQCPSQAHLPEAMGDSGESLGAAVFQPPNSGEGSRGSQ